MQVDWLYSIINFPDQAGPMNKQTILCIFDVHDP